MDQTVIIYRDLTNLTRFPIDIYQGVAKGILTFLIPVGMMVAFPVKAMLGLISPAGVIWSLGLAGFWFWIALKFWHFALTKYTSASS